MDTFKTLTLAYCVACITCGILRELMPEENSRTVIKALSGLYIVLVILYGVKTENWQFSLPRMEPLTLNSGYAQSLLQQSELQLETGCNARLAAAGLDARADFTLSQENETAVVSGVTITSPQPLSDAEHSAAEKILADYAPAETLYQSGADADG